MEIRLVKPKEAGGGPMLVARNGNGPTVVRVGKGNGTTEFGRRIVLIAGPCAVESEKQMVETARAVKEGGADMLRGGAFKPRTSPYSFQGMGEEGLRILKTARDETGLPVVTEVMGAGDIELFLKHGLDMMQIGARNMRNFQLLKEVGNNRTPILLKRGPDASLEELLYAAEYILDAGNPNVVLCERGMRTFEKHTRNTLDISAVPALNELTHLPVIVDPSHGTGRVSLIGPMSLAAIAAGAHGLMVEVHVNPAQALCDGEQTLTPAQFTELAGQLRQLKQFMDKITAETGMPAMAGMLGTARSPVRRPYSYDGWGAD